VKTGRFTEEENELIRKMLRRGATYEDLQEALNRTFESIRQRVMIMRSVEDLPQVMRKDYAVNGYTVAEEAKILAMHEAGFPMGVIAKELGRSYGSVKDKVNRMRKSGVRLKFRRKSTAETRWAVCRRHNVTVGQLTDLLFRKNRVASAEVVEWMAQQTVAGGYKSIGEWLVDEAVDRYFEENKDDG